MLEGGKKSSSTFHYQQEIISNEEEITSVNYIEMENNSSNVENDDSFITGLMEYFKNLKNEMFNKKYLLNVLWQLLVFILSYLVLIAFFDKDALPPNGQMYHLYWLFILAHIFGKLCDMTRLPSLLGMLVAGFMYGNVFHTKTDKILTSFIRNIALMIILLRAGLHLKYEYLKKIPFAFIRVTAVPFAAETLTVALCSYLFFQFNLSWSLMLGFVLAAVSPAVVVPCMIRIKKAGLSKDKGIPTLNIAASSIDDVLAVTGFNICFDFAFADEKNSIIWTLLKASLEILGGIFFGIFIGTLLWYIPELSKPKNGPNSDHSNSSKNDQNLSRLILLLLSAIVAVFGSKYLGIEAAGPLAVLIMGFVPTIQWEKDWIKDCENGLKIVWIIFKRFLFCLIGADLQISQLQTDIIIKALGCLIIGLALKILVAYLMTYGIKLNPKERLFTAISWLPKATVQAAIGPIALASAKTEQQIKDGTIILTAAAISILVTAPIGAIVIDKLSTLLLTKPEPKTNCNTDSNNNETDQSTPEISW